MKTIAALREFFANPTNLGSADSPGEIGGAALLGYAESSAGGNTTTDTLVLMNAALSITGVVPANGQLLVVANVVTSNNAGSRNVYVGLLDGASAPIAGTERLMGDNITIKPGTYRRVLSGLTPGAAFTYKLGFRDGHASGLATWFDVASFEIWSTA